jgi:transcriptional regulator with XRE-family HTH domain
VTTTDAQAATRKPRPAKDVPVERKIFARKFRAARKAAGYKQADFYALAGFSKAYISNIERCKVNISFDNASELSRIVGVPLYELLKP